MLNTRARHLTMRVADRLHLVRQLQAEFSHLDKINGFKLTRLNEAFNQGLNGQADG